MSHFWKRNTIVIWLERRKRRSDLLWLLPCVLLLAFTMKRHHLAALALLICLSPSSDPRLDSSLKLPLLSVSLGSGSRPFDGKSRCLCIFLMRSCVGRCEGGKGRQSVGAEGGVFDMYVMYSVCTCGAAHCTLQLSPQHVSTAIAAWAKQIEWVRLKMKDNKMRESTESHWWTQQTENPRVVLAEDQWQRVMSLQDYTIRGYIEWILMFDLQGNKYCL